MKVHRRGCPFAVCAVLALALVAPPAAVGRGDRLALRVAHGGRAAAHTSVAAPLQAFILTSSPDSFSDLQAHPGAIGTIYPTYFQCAVPSGAVQGLADPAVDAYAAAHALAELPRFTCQDGPTVHRILTEPRLRARTLARLVALVEGVGGGGQGGEGAPSARYAGLNLDLENDGARDRGALSSFVAALAARLHAVGRELAVDVDGVVREAPGHATYFYDDRALAALADTVFVIAWGIHWERSVPGPIAPLPYVEGVARRLARLPHARRFVLGVPMYGLEWSARGGPAHPALALQYASVLALAHSVAATPARDPSSGEMTFSYARAGVAHHVWYLDAHAVAQRLALARRFGLTAGLWRLGEEDEEVWGLPGV
jgi:spore germination protein YaaH